MSDLPELLAPAGGREALIAAVQNGADAVYLGAGSFNARQSADNFGGSLLDEAVQYCHERGVKVYVTLNTMVRQDEWASLEDSVVQIARSCADAVLVQDFGVARMVHAMVPDLPLHASTQMAVHNREGVEFLAKQGFARVVLAREMSVSEIQTCANLGAELEVFVHGALCVSCSGQCLFSSMVGGRSGNRGRCAQPCRQKYKMDGHEGYLLSTRDLCAIHELEALRRAGVDSFKIEGRLKRPEYVAAVTQAYRRAIDHPNEKQDDRPLKQMFNRGGFTRGYLTGVEDVNLMYAQRPNHLGVAVGECVRSGQVRLDADIDAADALVLRGKGEDRPVKLSGNAGGKVSCATAKAGEILIRLVSEQQMRTCRESWDGEHRLTLLNAHLTLQVGQPAVLEVSDGNHTARAEGEIVAEARSRGADIARIEAQLRKTGGTPYLFGDIRMDVDERAFCPVSALNALRRDALDALTKQRLPKPWAVHPVSIDEMNPESCPVSPAVVVQSGNVDVLKRAREAGADRVVFAPQDVRIETLESIKNDLPERFGLALPMTLGETSLLQLDRWAQSMKDRIDRTYISNIGQLNLAWPGMLMADASLNIANRAAIAQLTQWGIEGFTPSVELNVGQIAALGGAPELIVHGRMTLMQLRHCPYRAVHEMKGRHDACRRCDRCAPQDKVDGRVLTDRMGAAFPLRRLATDEGCIVQVLNSVPTLLLKRANRLPKASAWRLMIDNAEEAEVLVRLYRKAARGEELRSDPEWTAIEAMNTTTGHYFRGAE